MRTSSILGVVLLVVAVVGAATPSSAAGPSPESRGWLGVLLGDAVDGGVELVAVALLLGGKANIKFGLVNLVLHARPNGHEHIHCRRDGYDRHTRWRRNRQRVSPGHGARRLLEHDAGLYPAGAGNQGLHYGNIRDGPVLRGALSGTGFSYWGRASTSP